MSVSQKPQAELIGNRFLQRRHVGQGTFGIVYSGEDKETRQIVALKKVRVRSAQDGIDYNTIQEIRQLQELNHPNIVKFIGAYHHQGSLYVVSEFLHCSLEKLLYSPDKSFLLSDADIKSIMKQILTGMQYLHENWILHRDMKPANIMFSLNGTLKLIDFGLSCDYPSDFGELISQVVTVFYKAPELIYDSRQYGPAIDIWSVGCIMAELFLRKPFLPGRNDEEELQYITNAFGPAVWPGCDKLKGFRKVLPSTEIRPLSFTFGALTKDALDLLSKLMCLDPSKRITAAEALQHPYFYSNPEPTIPSKLPLPPPDKGIVSSMTTTGVLTGFTALTNRVIKAPGTALIRK